MLWIIPIDGGEQQMVAPVVLLFRSTLFDDEIMKMLKNKQFNAFLSDRY